ncbi:chloride channel protein [Sphingomonas sp. AR_OL41]|uniref:chloride channel protein n=1 Tax=Sphingomonas sp. AR_OL41 TaxID=3042729 RepID=UPI0024815B28|nr:chloride channel protein [Sphingomonas sp. AR_OL41]MDH7975854.1 chloride channel protein [Sphingomonas sp. AR_OL41]
MRSVNPLNPALIRFSFAWLRRRVRASEAMFILLAVGVGAVSALLSVVQGGIARTLQHLLFALPPAARLSAEPTLSGAILLVLPAGGAILALFSLAVRVRKRRLVDPVEANALHGGRMSLADSLVISGQTVLSNGFGASVGLEAAYTQLGGAIAAWVGSALALRRADLRHLVGAGAGAAIGAVFGAPLAGAFYAFEIVIGAYTPSAIAPVAAAALAGALVAQSLGVQPYVIEAVAGAPVETHHYIIYALLGALCAGYGIVLMRAVALVERGVRRIALPDWARPAIGGALLIPIALISPQALSAGHGALHADLAIGASLGFIATVLLAKSAASIVSLGFGFRGGLFFASLFLGTLLGHLFAAAVTMVVGHQVIDPHNAALVGMAALAVAVVGGPMTMAMLVLQATHDFSLTGAVVAAALVASTIVRETFGYSFSTWRLHLRGETIKSARDVGWVKTLTAGRMMRRETRATPDALTIAEFRHRYPLGSTSRVVLCDGEGHYAGVVQTAAAYAEGRDPGVAIATLAANRDTALTPETNIVEVMKAFDRTGSDELAVVAGDRHVLGILSETYVRRRYAEELEKAQRDLFGE